MKIAMWSGPRNLSTAMMYSFGNRSDCQITDEPFYAAYLEASGIQHPMNEEILASQPTKPDRVIRDVLAPNDKPIWYQKHMTHHMLPHFSLEWLSKVTNVFLIRDPRRVIASYAAKRTDLSLKDLGFKQQLRLYDHCYALGLETYVVDSDDILRDPRGALTALCAAIKIPFDENMLTWAPGPRSEDGVWAAHWYDGVHKSTGFGAPKENDPVIAKHHQGILDEAECIYHTLSGQVIRPAT